MLYVLYMIGHMTIWIIKKYRRILNADGLQGHPRFLLAYFNQRFPMQFLPCFIRAVISGSDIYDCNATTF